MTDNEDSRATNGDFSKVPQRARFWQVVGGALAFLIAAGIVSYSAALRAVGESAESRAKEKIEALLIQAELDAERIRLAAEASEDPVWALAHAAAGAACAATSPVGGSAKARIVIPKREGRTCKASCQYETDGEYTQCSTSVAIGQIEMSKATYYGQVVAKYYNYGCGDYQESYDEVAGSTSSYTAYCCCYQPR